MWLFFLTFLHFFLFFNVNLFLFSTPAVHSVVVVSDLEEYCIHFETGGRNFILSVLLGLNFPSERPKLMLSPLVQHHWVNPTSGEIESAPGLVNVRMNTKRCIWLHVVVSFGGPDLVLCYVMITCHFVFISKQETVARWKPWCQSGWRQ